MHYAQRVASRARSHEKAMANLLQNIKVNPLMEPPPPTGNQAVLQDPIGN